MELSAKNKGIQEFNIPDEYRDGDTVELKIEVAQGRLIVHKKNYFLLQIDEGAPNSYFITDIITGYRLTALSYRGNNWKRELAKEGDRWIAGIEAARKKVKAKYKKFGIPYPLNELVP